MLARLISDTWHKDPQKEIFVGLNGSRFQFVLDYLRHGKVYLPMDVPKPMILQELDYFGFQDIPPDAVNEKYSTVKASALVANTCSDSEKEIVNQKETISKLEKDRKLPMLALACFKQYIPTGRLDNSVLDVVCNDKTNPELKDLPDARDMIHHSMRATRSKDQSQSHFNQHLSWYGLRATVDIIFFKLRLEVVRASEEVPEA